MAGDTAVAELDHPTLPVEATGIEVEEAGIAPVNPFEMESMAAPQDTSVSSESAAPKSPVSQDSFSQLQSFPSSGNPSMSDQPVQRGDDESTEPSTCNASEDPTKQGSTPLKRLVDYTRRRLTRESDDMVDGAVICGYLQKLGRNGKWQTRWFETDGECLSYYKTSKRVKLMATLDLEKVGNIVIDDSDTKGHSFNIQVLGRLYHLRATSRASCKDWVITLNRVKEARMEQGNVKLVEPMQPVDLLDPSAEVVAPRVVVVANRERTRAVNETQEWDRIMVGGAAAQTGDCSSPKSDVKRRTAIGTVVLARWSKRKTALSQLTAKLARWARSVRKFGCAQGSSVALDSRDTASSGVSGPTKAAVPAPITKVVKPPLVAREASDVSEDGARYLS